MNGILIQLGTTALVVISIAAAESLSSPQQYSAQTIQSGGGFAVAGPGMDRLEMLTHMLSLTGNQKEQAKAILDEEEAVSKPLAQQLQQASDALSTAEKAAAPDAEIDQWREIWQAFPARSWLPTPRRNPGFTQS